MMTGVLQSEVYRGVGFGGALMSWRGQVQGQEQLAAYMREFATWVAIHARPAESVAV